MTIQFQNLKEVLERNVEMHDAHRASIMRLWGAIAMLFVLQVATVMAVCIAMEVR